jgi:hypothetical protein
MAYSLSVAFLFKVASCLARTMGPERLAERVDHRCVATDYALAGVAKRILSAGDGIGKSRQHLG